MKLLVTGGLGFIGSNFILRLLGKQNDIEITNIDAELPGSNHENLSQSKDSDRYNFVKGNISNKKLMEETVLPVCSPRLMEGVDAIRKPQDLENHTLLHDEGSERDPSCPDWQSWLRARGVTSVDASRGPRFNQSMLVIEAAATGRGVALAKKAIAASDLACQSSTSRGPCTCSTVAGNPR